jgi:hypothetical protein
MTVELLHFGGRPSLGLRLHDGGKALPILRIKAVHNSLILGYSSLCIGADFQLVLGL